MKSPRNITWRVTLLLLFVVSVICSCGGNNMRLTEPAPDFFGIANHGDITLTIYYSNPLSLFVMPVSVDALIYGFTATNEPPVEKNDIYGMYEYKIVVKDGLSEGHFDLFKQISKDDLIPVEKKSSYLDVRVYYVLESEENGKLFDVAMWGDDGHSIYVNGVEVKESDIFYDAIMPFLPDNAEEALKKWRNRA